MTIFDQLLNRMLKTRFTTEANEHNKELERQEEQEAEEEVISTTGE